MPINKLQCSTNFANTGIGDCYLIPGHIVGQFLVPEDFELDADGVDSIKTQLQEAAENDNPAQRIYPIHGYVELEDNSADPTEGTFGYGGITITNDGNYDLSFRFMKGGLCLSNQLRRYNRSSVRTIYIDSNGILFGQLVDGKLKGIPLELFYVPKFTLSDGDAESAGFHVRNVFKPKYLNEQIAFIDTDALGFDPEEIKGLREVNFLNAGSDKTTVKVKPVVGCGGENLTDNFATELEGAIWVIKDPNDGSEITPLTVSVSGDVVEITAGSDFPDGQDVIVNFDKVSVLVGEGIVGFEGRATRIPIPA